MERVLAERPDLSEAASRLLYSPCFREGPCPPTFISRLLFLRLCHKLWAMSQYWCLCVKYADRCDAGCPVEPGKCAAAYVVAEVNPYGDVVRSKFYVYAKRLFPERFYNAFAKAAATLVEEAGGGAAAVPYENLLVAAVRYFFS